MAYQAVYIDMVFLVNFMMDLLLLSLLKGILRKNSRWPWLLAGAAAGAAWACVAVLSVMPWWMELTGSIAAAAAMTGISFQERRIKEACFMSLFLMALSFYLSGLAYLVYYHSGPGYVMQLYGMPSYLLFPVIGAGSAALYKGAGQFWQYQNIKRRLCRVVLSCGGSKAALTGLVDTGNQLYDPYGGRPVHIAEADSVQSILPKDAVFFYVPYRSVGKEDGLLQCFGIDEMIVTVPGQEKLPQVIRAKQQVIGLSPHGLSGSGRYQMIIHADILSRQEDALPGICQEGKQR